MDMSIWGAKAALEKRKKEREAAMGNIFGEVGAGSAGEEMPMKKKKKMSAELLRDMRERGIDDPKRYLRAKGYEPSEYDLSWYYD